MPPHIMSEDTLYRCNEVQYVYNVVLLLLLLIFSFRHPVTLWPSLQIQNTLVNIFLSSFPLSSVFFFLKLAILSMTLFCWHIPSIIPLPVYLALLGPFVWCFSHSVAPQVSSSVISNVFDSIHSAALQSLLGWPFASMAPGYLLTFLAFWWLAFL